MHVYLDEGLVLHTYLRYSEDYFEGRLGRGGLERAWAPLSLRCPPGREMLPCLHLGCTASRIPLQTRTTLHGGRVPYPPPSPVTAQWYTGSNYVGFHEAGLVILRGLLDQV